MQDKESIIKFIISEWLREENEAYDKCLKRKNEYIDRLHHVIADLCRENERLTREERILYDHNGRPATFRRDAMGRFVEVMDLTESPRSVRRRLDLDSDSDSDASTVLFE